MSGKQFTLEFAEAPAVRGGDVIKGKELKNVIAGIYRFCIHFRSDVGKCYFLGSDIQPCVYEKSQTVCPNFKTRNKEVCTKFKKKLVTWFDLVDWEIFDTQFGRSLQETVDRYDEPVDRNRGNDEVSL